MSIKLEERLFSCKGGQGEKEGKEGALHGPKMRPGRDSGGVSGDCHGRNEGHGLALVNDLSEGFGQKPVVGDLLGSEASATRRITPKRHTQLLRNV